MPTLQEIIERRKKVSTPIIRPAKTQKPIEPDLEKSKTSKTRKIIDDKDFDKPRIIEYILELIKNNEEVFILDFLRGQKLIYDSIHKMRK